MSKIATVIRHGTLRSSCQSFMENRICHLFAGLVAFMDTNRNLDLLTELASNELKQLWLYMLNDPDFFDMSYRSYLLADNVEKNEFVCLSMTSKQSVRLRLPFSWLIKHKMDQIIGLKAKQLDLKNPATSRDVYKGVFEQFSNAFQESKQLRFFDDSKHLIDLYIHDYLLIAFNDYPFVDEKHLQIVIDRIKTVSIVLFEVVDLVSATFSFAILKNELILFSKFVQYDHKVLQSLF